MIRPVVQTYSSKKSGNTPSVATFFAILLSMLTFLPMANGDGTAVDGSANLDWNGDVLPGAIAANFDDELAESQEKS